MSTVLRRNLLFCALLFFIVLAPALQADNGLYPFSGDIITISGIGTQGIYLGEPINNNISTYSVSSGYAVAAIGNVNLNFQEGSNIVTADAFDAALFIEGGGASTVNITGGAITSSSAVGIGVLIDQVRVNISGGKINAGTGIIVRDYGIVDIFGKDLVATDSNGQKYFNRVPVGKGIITGTLLNGESINIKYIVSGVSPIGIIEFNVGSPPIFPKPELKIVSTSISGIFNLGEANGDGRSVNIPLRIVTNAIVTGNVNWTLNLTYTSPVTHHILKSSDTRVLSTAQCMDAFYFYPIIGKGGQIGITASAEVGGQVISDATVYAVNGYTTALAPVNKMTVYLKQLYKPILCGIADSESAYGGRIGQFKSSQPQINSSGAPTAAGLMQINIKDDLNAYDVFSAYWDWQVNATLGANIFATKLNNVIAQRNKVLKQLGVVNATPLSQFQIENWAVALYKGIGLANGPVYQYDVKNRIWFLNPSWASQTYNYSPYPTYKATINQVRIKANQLTGDANVLKGIEP